jgi:y4mF family transcriptional regulator
MQSLADVVRLHRRKSGLTQPGLAALAGVSRSVIWDIENGKESVQWDTLQKVFRVLNLSVEWRSPILEREASSSGGAS